MGRRRRRECGQAAVELLGVAIVLGVLTLVGWQAVLAAHAWQTAQAAARTAARARLVGAPVERAALAALPGHLAGRATVTTGDGSADGSSRVRVSVAIPRVLPGRGSFGVVSGDAAVGR
jgi:hypothetical protein